MSICVSGGLIARSVGVWSSWLDWKEYVGAEMGAGMGTWPLLNRCQFTVNLRTGIPPLGNVHTTGVWCEPRLVNTAWPLWIIAARPTLTNINRLHAPLYTICSYRWLYTQNLNMWASRVYPKVLSAALLHDLQNTMPTEQSFVTRLHSGWKIDVGGFGILHSTISFAKCTTSAINLERLPSFGYSTLRYKMSLSCHNYTVHGLVSMCGLSK